MRFGNFFELKTLCLSRIQKRASTIPCVRPPTTLPPASTLHAPLVRFLEQRIPEIKDLPPEMCIDCPRYPRSTGRADSSSAAAERCKNEAPRRRPTALGQGEGKHIVALFCAELAMPPGRDDKVLLTIQTVGHRSGLATGREEVFPELFAGFASSAESMGRFWFGKSSERVIEGDFHRFIGPKPVGSSGHHSNFVVEAFDRPSRNLSFGAEPVQQ